MSTSDFPGAKDIAERLAKMAEHIDSGPRDDLAALIGHLEALKARAWARLAAPRPAPAASADSLLTFADVARRLGIGEWNAREMGRRGEIPTVHVGQRRVRVRESALNEYIRKNERGAMMPRGR